MMRQEPEPSHDPGDPLHFTPGHQPGELVMLVSVNTS
jgi:hypothetical protein